MKMKTEVYVPVVLARGMYPTRYRYTKGQPRTTVPVPVVQYGVLGWGMTHILL